MGRNHAAQPFEIVTDMTSDQQNKLIISAHPHGTAYTLELLALSLARLLATVLCPVLQDPRYIADTEVWHTYVCLVTTKVLHRRKRLRHFSQAKICGV
jgi:hypothetical protein